MNVRGSSTRDVDDTLQARSRVGNVSIGCSPKPTELELAWIRNLTTTKSMTYAFHAQNGLECDEKRHSDHHLDSSLSKAQRELSAIF